MELTKAQKEAIYSDSKNILVNASAGSGKTSVFAARIAHLVKGEGVDPSRILALTFSKEAAENMKKRVSTILDKEKTKKIDMSTFHSFAYRLLFSNFPSFYKNQQMMKDWWKVNQLFTIANEITDLEIDAPQLGMFVSYQKANMVLKNMPVVIDENTKYASESNRKALQAAYKLFLERCKNARLIEFDDLLLHLYYRFETENDFLEMIRSKYDYIMVDEFQDTSHINLEILKKITSNSLFVVGDFRQGIYGFINADIKNILNFADEFEDVHTIELTYNFRSTKRIVDLSNSLIEHRDIPEYKQFKPAKSAISVKGEKPDFNIYATSYLEAVSIVEKIESLVNDEDYSYEDFGVLVRTNSQMGVYESEFAKREIPLDTSQSKSFFNRIEIDTLLCYLKVMLDKDDNLSMSRIINKPARYISKKVLNELDEFSYRKGISTFEGISEYEGTNGNSNLSSMKALLTRFDDTIDSTSPEKVLKAIISSTKFYEHLSKTSKVATDYEIKKQSVESLLMLSKNFANIEKLLTHISIIQSNNKKPAKNSVKLMTVHASKGLEFDYVFVPSISDDYFPHNMCNGNYEEEARLLYVAVSRAKFNLSLSYNIESADPDEPYAKPSRFITPVFTDIKKAQKKLFMGEKVVSVAA